MDQHNAVVPNALMRTERSCGFIGSCRILDFCHSSAQADLLALSGSDLSVLLFLKAAVQDANMIRRNSDKHPSDRMI